MTIELIDLEKLKEADPRSFALLCEKAGYKNQALEYFYSSTNLNDLYHAAHLAIDLKKYEIARELIKKAKTKVGEPIPYHDDNWARPNPDNKRIAALNDSRIRFLLSLSDLEKKLVIA